jgi:hypothetical protein
MRVEFIKSRTVSSADISPASDINGPKIDEILNIRAQFTFFVDLVVTGEIKWVSEEYKCCQYAITSGQVALGPWVYRSAVDRKRLVPTYEYLVEMVRGD